MRYELDIAGGMRDIGERDGYVVREDTGERTITLKMKVTQKDIRAVSIARPPTGR